MVNNSQINNPEIKEKYFERLYFAVRHKEARIYTDEQLKLLPEIDWKHPHYNEWKIRKRSGTRLIDYLFKKKKDLRILEIGCGNGWLCAGMAAIPGAEVTGIDINKTEIEQARRVFRNNNLRFVYGAFNENIVKGAQFDVIVFAASIQYFCSLKQTLQQVFPLLSKDGEIHITDTHFYKPAEAANAGQRSFTYYTSMGFPEMSEHYFHHSISELDGLNYTVLSAPGSILNFFSKKGPFYWIALTR